jgi:hypothetical protein
MELDTWYVLNPKTNRFVKADGKVASTIPGHPAHMMIDTDNQLVRISTRSMTFNVKHDQEAKAILRANHYNMNLFYSLHDKYAL